VADDKAPKAFMSSGQLRNEENSDNVWMQKRYTVMS